MPEITISNSDLPHPLRDVTNSTNSTNSHSHLTPANDTDLKLASTEQRTVDNRASKGIFPSFVYRDEIEVLNLENMIGTPFLSENEESDDDDEEEEDGGNLEELQSTHNQNSTINQEIDLLAEHTFAQSLQLRDSSDVSNGKGATILRGVPKPAGSHIRFDD